MRKLSTKEGQDLVGLIQRNAVAAGQAYDRQGAAFEAEHEAEVAILERAIELARPGLPSISNAIDGEHYRGVELVPGDGNNGGLWLSENGTFVWEERTSKPRQLQTISRVLEGWGLPEILRPLAALFEKQVKGREPSSEKAEKRAAKLLALAELIDGFEGKP